jgi:pSer/pThr/pTyr-binding forkhead associated (FHA) protein
VPDAVVWIADRAVSRRHARILVDARGATLEDLGSKNGTLLNGRPLEAPAPLADGDEIGLGEARIEFRSYCSAADSTETSFR